MKSLAIQGIREVPDSHGGFETFCRQPSLTTWNWYSVGGRSAANDDVIFPGAIYVRNVVESLRYFARCYVHGHTVGGTNPLLVEALGAGCAILTHDYVYSKRVTCGNQIYFRDVDDLEKKITLLDTENEGHYLERLRLSSKKQFAAHYTRGKGWGHTGNYSGYMLSLCQRKHIQQQPYAQ
jgi:hypothetical protein